MVPRPIADGTSPSAGGAGRRVVVGISGASGAIYGIRALELLHGAAVETHLVVTAGGRKTITSETDYLLSDVYAMADFVYNPGDLGAAIASGSFLVDGMLVAPCSVKTLSAIASSYDNNLVVRAADVMLKERRPLVLMVRETPLSYTHLRLMSEATLAGAIIAPPVPAFYHGSCDLDEVVTQSVGRALDALKVPVTQTKRWTGMP
jgi:flavin prenyltransferase